MALQILILTAVTLEARAVARALRLKRSGTHWSGDDVELHAVGIRAVRLPAALADAPAIILAGLAGGLDPRLRVGDIVIDAASHPLPANPKYRLGKIHTAVSPVVTPREKAALFQGTGAAAVEMENAAVRAALVQRHCDTAAPTSPAYLHIRAISDAAGDSIDPATIGLIDELGNPRVSAIAATLIRRPGMIKELRRLGRDANLAAANLAATVAEIVASGWPAPRSDGPTGV